MALVGVFKVNEWIKGLVDLYDQWPIKGFLNIYVSETLKGLKAKRKSLKAISLFKI